MARPYSGTAGRLENCHIGVFVGDASRLGHALLDRELYRPKAWADDPARCRQAGLPEDRRFATKPPLAQRMLQRALAAGVPARWVTGDSVYGDDRRLRMWLEGQPHAYVLAVSGTEHVWLDWRQRRVNTLLAGLPLDGWTRLSAGDGTKGPRWYDWRWLPLADPVHPPWRRWLLVRRSVSAPQELQASVVFAPQDTTLEAVVRVAGTRWVIEQLFEAAKGEVGLDHYEVRSWTGWDSPYHPRHVGVGPVDRLAGGGPCGGAAKKKPAASPGGQSSDSVQSQPRPRLPLSVPEIRRLLWRLVLAVEQTAHHILAWSRWRRWHQQLATYYHDQQRGAWLGLLAA